MRRWTAGTLLCPGGAVAAAALVGATLLGCLDPTQITLEIATDADCGRTQGTRIAVGQLGQLDRDAPSAQVDRCDHSTGAIGTLAAVPSGADDAKVAFEVVTAIDEAVEDCVEDRVGSGCIVARRALSYLPHEPLRLPILMREQCAGIICPPEDTCVLGDCVPATLDPERCRSDEGCGEEVLLTEPTVPDTGWTKVLGGGGEDLPTALGRDAQGNIYLCGSFQQSIDLDGESLTTQGPRALFAVSYTAQGELRWSRQLDSTDPNVRVSAMAVAPDGAVYLAGDFEGEIQGTAEPLVSVDGRDGFTLRLGPGGAPDWQRVHAGLGTPDFTGLVLDASQERLFAAADFTNALLFAGAPGPLLAGQTDIVVVRFDGTTGSYVEAAHIETTDRTEVAAGLAFQAPDRLFLAGLFAAALTIGPDELPYVDSDDVFVGAFDATPAPTGGFALGGIGLDITTSIALDPSSNPCVAGYFHSTLYDGHPGVPAGDEPDGFVACFDDGGSRSWTIELGGAGSQRVQAMSSDGDYLHVAGMFAGTMDHASPPLVSPSDPRDSPFVMTLAARDQGAHVWSRAYRVTGTAQNRAILGVDQSGVYLAGSFDADFDLGADGVATADSTDIYLMWAVPDGS